MPTRLATVIATATLVLASAITTSAQTKPQCADAEKSHQFDFWIGDWEVTAGGNVAGTNRIERILDGCVLQETWAGAQGSAGSSFNYYNPQTKKWHQHWVWRNGTTLESSGAYADGKMTLEGDSVTRKGEKIRNRITWYDNDDGTVRQHWQISKDAGKTWSDAFDGLYTQKKAATKRQ